MTRIRAFLLVPALALAASGAVTAPQEYSEEGGEACVDCHDTPEVMSILETAHADFDNPDTPAAQKQCQSCHGPSATHMRFPMQVANVHFGKKSRDKPELQNERCIECHGTGEAQKAWSASAHGFEKVVCSACHSMHDPGDIVPREAHVTEHCMECHDDMFEGVDLAAFSHAVGRPIDGEGEINCSACHNPHGPLESSRCVDCHSQEPAELAKESEKARRYHEVAAKRGTECMRCHKGIAHPITAMEKASALQGSPADGAMKGLEAQ
jgi:hypothetical protein